MWRRAFTCRAMDIAAHRPWKPMPRVLARALGARPRFPGAGDNRGGTVRGYRRSVAARDEG